MRTPERVAQIVRTEAKVQAKSRQVMPEASFLKATEFCLFTRGGWVASPNKACQPGREQRASSGGRGSAATWGDKEPRKRGKDLLEGTRKTDQDEACSIYAE